MPEDRGSLWDRIINTFVLLGAAAGTVKIAQSFGRSTPSQNLLGLGDAPGDEPELHELSIQSVEERIDILRDLIKTGRHDPNVILTTRKALSKRCGDTWCTAERDYDAEVVVVFEEAKRNVRYTLDAVDADTFVHPKWTLESGGGDCDCEVVLLSSMLGAVGYPTKFRVVQTHEAVERGEDWDHIYLLAGLPPQKPTKWVALDLSEPQPPGWEVPDHLVARRRDFDV